MGLYRRPPLAAAGDGECVSRDVGGLVGGQEQDRVGDFLRTAETPQRGHAIGAVLHRLVEPPQRVAHPLGVDGPGATALTLMPCSASSSATSRMKPCTP